LEPPASKAVLALPETFPAKEKLLSLIRAAEVGAVLIRVKAGRGFPNYY